MDFVPFESGPIAPTTPAKPISAAPSTNIFRKYWWAWVLGACVLIGVTVGVVVATLPKSKKGVTRVFLDRTSYKEGDTVKATFNTDKTWEDHKIRWDFSADNKATWIPLKETSGVNFIVFTPPISSSSSQCFVRVIDELDANRVIESDVFAVQLDLSITRETPGSEPNEKIDPATSLKVTLAWTTPWLSEPATTWQYRTKVDSGDWGAWITVTLTAKSFTFTTPASGEEFQYQVKATNGSNTETLTSEWILLGDLTFTVVTLDANNKPCQRFAVSNTIVIDIDTGSRPFPTNASFALTYQIGGAGPTVPIASTTTDKYSWVVPASVDNKSLTISATYTGQTVAALPVQISSTPGLSSVAFDVLKSGDQVDPGSVVTVDVTATGSGYDFTKLKFWYNSKETPTDTLITAVVDDTNPAVNQKRYRITTPSTANTGFSIGAGVNAATSRTTTINVQSTGTMAVQSVDVIPSPSSLTVFTFVVTYSGTWMPGLISASETETKSTTIAGSTFTDGPKAMQKQFTYTDAGTSAGGRIMRVVVTGTNAKTIDTSFTVSAGFKVTKLEVTNGKTNYGQSDILKIKATMLSSNALSDWAKFGPSKFSSSIGFVYSDSYTVTAGASNEVIFTLSMQTFILERALSLPIQNLTFSVPTSVTDSTRVVTDPITVSLVYTMTNANPSAAVVDTSSLDPLYARAEGLVTVIDITALNFGMMEFMHNFSVNVDSKPIKNFVGGFLSTNSIRVVFFVLNTETKSLGQPLAVDITCTDTVNQTYAFHTTITLREFDPNAKPAMQYMYGVTIGNLGKSKAPKKDVYQMFGSSMNWFKSDHIRLCPATENKDSTQRVLVFFSYEMSTVDKVYIVTSNAFGTTGTAFVSNQLNTPDLANWVKGKFYGGSVTFSQDKNQIGLYRRDFFDLNGNGEDIERYKGINYVQQLITKKKVPFVLSNIKVDAENDLQIIPDSNDYGCGSLGSGWAVLGPINPPGFTLKIDPRTIWFLDPTSNLQDSIGLTIET